MATQRKVKKNKEILILHLSRTQIKPKENKLRLCKTEVEKFMNKGFNLSTLGYQFEHT